MASPIIEEAVKRPFSLEVSPDLQEWLDSLPLVILLPGTPSPNSPVATCFPRQVALFFSRPAVEAGFMSASIAEQQPDTG